MLMVLALGPASEVSSEVCLRHAAAPSSGPLDLILQRAGFSHPAGGKSNDEGVFHLLLKLPFVGMLKIHPSDGVNGIKRSAEMHRNVIRHRFHDCSVESALH